MDSTFDYDTTGKHNMWKESYRLGVEQIDREHYDLFKMVADLLQTFEIGKDWVDKEGCKAAIEYMKHYVVQHFSHEEAYQISVNYSDFENHQKEHRDFTAVVLDYEKQFIATDYDLKIVKEFAGKLVAWLIYHVAETDQRIVGRKTDPLPGEFQSYINCFSQSIIQVLESMVGIDDLAMHEASLDKNQLTGDIFVNVGLLGDHKGNAVFSFSRDLAFKLLKNMTFIEVDEIDELVCSAMAEIANIISGNAATALSNVNHSCDIATPVVTVSQYDSDCTSAQRINVISADSALGTLNVAVID